MAIGSYYHMQKDDSNKRKITTSVEIVDVPPSVVENEMPLKSDNIQDGPYKIN